MNPLPSADKAKDKGKKTMSSRKEFVNYASEQAGKTGPGEAVAGKYLIGCGYRAPGGARDCRFIIKQAKSALEAPYEKAAKSGLHESAGVPFIEYFLLKKHGKGE